MRACLSSKARSRRPARACRSVRCTSAIRTATWLRFPSRPFEPALQREQKATPKEEDTMRLTQLAVAAIALAFSLFATEGAQAQQLGAVQMLAPSVSKFGPLGVRKFEVFDLPYMFADEKSLEQVVEGPVGTGLFKLLEPKGITGLAYWFNGFKEFTANTSLKKLVAFT